MAQQSTNLERGDRAFAVVELIRQHMQRFAESGTCLLTVASLERLVDESICKFFASKFKSAEMYAKGITLKD